MTPEQLHILQHSLGVDQYGQGRMYRNHFCAGGADEDGAPMGGDAVICAELVALGYMKRHATTEMLPYFNCSVTEAGKAAMLAESPKPPKLTRAQFRYRQFLAEDSGMKYGEWLKAQKHRRNGR